MGEDDEQALASLRQELKSLQEQIKTYDEQRRLFEKLGYSRYYLDMQLRGLQTDLGVCRYRLRQLEQKMSAAARARPRLRRSQPTIVDEISTRHLLPVTGAFIISVLALSAAGLLWYQRFGPPPRPTPVPTAMVLAASPQTPSPTPTLAVASPTPTTLVNAVVQTEALNVRMTPGTSAAVLGILARGTIIQLADDQADAEGKVWYHIKDGGWVSAEHVKIYGTRQEAEDAAQELLR